MENHQIPREEGIDHSLDFLKEGYHFILNRRQSLQSNVFETRILGKKAICMVGKEAAQIFYDTTKFKRSGAAPNRVIQTLFGKNSVQTLDGDEHKYRKELLMSVMTPEETQKLADVMKLEFEQAIDKWSKMNEVVLYEEMKELLCKVAFKWVGYPLHEDDVKTMTNEVAAMFETPAAVGAKNWGGRIARNQVEKRMQSIIQDIRDKKLQPSQNTVLYKFSFHQELNGDLLDIETVAVEVINMIRPIVAISIFINFIILALHQFPQEREKLNSYPDYANMFIQEVRRYYPFFPFAAARVKEDFTWNGYHFEEETLTLLDLYGTNHDPTIWDNPDQFNPERFAERDDNPYDFIPQGGGYYKTGHRCAGEKVTIELMKISLDYLANRMQYTLPEQDLSFGINDIPSIPNSKIIVQNVKRNQEKIH